MPTDWSGKILALGLTCLVLAAAWAAVVLPLLELHAERTEALAHQGTLADRMTALARTLPALQQRATVAVENGPPANAILQGSTDSVAGAMLQQFVQDMATQAGVSLASTESLAAEQVHAYRIIGVRIALTAQWPALVQLLQTIERAKPTMLVDDLQLHGPRLQLNQVDSPIEASMTVLAFRVGPTSGAGQ